MGIICGTLCNVFEEDSIVTYVLPEIHVRILEYEARYLKHIQLLSSEVLALAV
jgi:hypothetical protein